MGYDVPSIRYEDAACTPSPSRFFFEFTVVRLIDGYVGQVNCGGEIIHQTRLFEGEDETNPPARAALEQARKDLIEKMKGLFN